MPSIRPYQVQDRPAAAFVYSRAIREGAAAFYTEPEHEARAAFPEPTWKKPDKLLDQWCHVAEEDGRMSLNLGTKP